MPSPAWAVSLGRQGGFRPRPNGVVIAGQGRSARDFGEEHSFCLRKRVKKEEGKWDRWWLWGCLAARGALCLKRESSEEWRAYGACDV